MLIRHDKSAYNELKDTKCDDATYQEFLRAFDTKPHAPETQALARKIKETFALGVSDAQTPLGKEEGKAAVITGEKLRAEHEVPDVVFVSPYVRTRKTLESLTKGWPELANVKTVEEDRIREQEHGLSLIYNDWRAFQSLHPEQYFLHAQEGKYWYRYPQGENVADVRLRNRSWVDTLVRDYSEKKVLVVTHHLTILALRANFERMGEKEFIHLDEHEKPINCGVTLYRGNPAKGKDGKLELDYYNKKYY